MSNWFTPGTWRYAFPLFVVGGPLLFLFPAVAAGCILAGLAVLYFHRDPPRSPPAEGVLSPADGTVSVIREENGRLRVGVFMNVHNVHVNRAPVAGTVDHVTHIDGAHKPAFSKDSDRNERVHVDYGDYRVTLIAGAFARRIHPYVDAETGLDRGDRIGHISFGSRADVLFPPSVERSDLAVEEGDGVRAGESVLARER